MVDLSFAAQLDQWKARVVLLGITLSNQQWRAAAVLWLAAGAFDNLQGLRARAVIPDCSSLTCSSTAETGRQAIPQRQQQQGGSSTAAAGAEARGAGTRVKEQHADSMPAQQPCTSCEV